MGTVIIRKQTAFRLSTDLLKRLRIEANKENRSLNNYVESVLMDVIYNEPNEETKAAIEEVRAGKFAGTIDMKNFDTFMKSINDIE
jgi:hypothetical protein